jgi:hypothetical protein
MSNENYNLFVCNDETNTYFLQNTYNPQPTARLLDSLFVAIILCVILGLRQLECEQDRNSEQYRALQERLDELETRLVQLAQEYGGEVPSTVIQNPMAAEMFDLAAATAGKMDDANIVQIHAPDQLNETVYSSDWSEEEFLRNEKACEEASTSGESNNENEEYQNAHNEQFDKTASFFGASFADYLRENRSEQDISNYDRMMESNANASNNERLTQSYAGVRKTVCYSFVY